MEYPKREEVASAVSSGSLSGHPSQAYAVLGEKVNEVELLKDGHMSEAKFALAAWGVKDSVTAWDRLREARYRFFTETYWVVDLEQRSRTLGPGRMVFTVERLNYSFHDVPSAVVTAVSELRCVLPHHLRLFYLQPAYLLTRYGRVAVTPEELERRRARQDKTLRRHLGFWNFVERLLPRWAYKGLQLIAHDPLVVFVDPLVENRCLLRYVAHWD